MKCNHPAPCTIQDLRRCWPLKRTMLFCGVTAFITVLAALHLPLWIGILPLTAFLLCLLLPVLRRPRTLLLCGTVALFWVCCMGHQVLRVLPQEQLAGQSDTLVGWVESCPTTNHLYTLRVTEAGRVPVGSRVLLYCPDVCAPLLHERVSATVTLSATSSYQASHRGDGIFLLAFPIGYGEDAVTISGKQSPLPLLHQIQQLREPLQNSLRRMLPMEEGALLGALCLGERQGLSATVQTDFRNSGLSHLLVVSGLHLSILTAAIQRLFLLLRLSRRMASALTILPVILFMLLIGLTPSVVRAGIMCLLWLVGQLTRRRANGLNSLGIAALLLLGNNPYMATDPGALLSFFATAGVLTLASCLLTPATEKETLPQRAKRRITVSLVTCLGAMLFVLPLLCYYFGQFPLITPIANLLAILPATAALLCGWAGLLLNLVPWLSFLGDACLLAAGGCANLTKAVIALCSSHAGPVIVSTLWQMLLITGSCVLLTLVILRGDRRIRRYVVIGLLLLSVLAGCTDVVLSTAVTVTAFAAGSDMALLIGGKDATLFVAHSDGLESAAYLLKERGITHLRYLLLGECLPQHAAHLASLLRQTTATEIFCATPTVWAAGLSHPITYLPATEALATPYGIWQQDSPAHWWLQMGQRQIYTYPNGSYSSITLPADGTLIRV